MLYCFGPYFHSAHPSGYKDKDIDKDKDKDNDKDKDKDNEKDNNRDNDKDKDTDKVSETPNICYIFEILMTDAFQK